MVSGGCPVVLFLQFVAMSSGDGVWVMLKWVDVGDVVSEGEFVHLDDITSGSPVTHAG